MTVVIARVHARRLPFGPLSLLLSISPTLPFILAWTVPHPPAEMTTTTTATTTNTRYPGGEVIGSSGSVGRYILNLLNREPILAFPRIIDDDDDDDDVDDDDGDPSSSSSNGNDGDQDDEDHRRRSRRRRFYHPQSQNAAALPRGMTPGCLSPDNAPIYACVPSSSISDVWSMTSSHRRKDLVFLCNCVPSRHMPSSLSSSSCDEPPTPEDDDGNITIAILHFGVSPISTTRMSSSSSFSSSISPPPTVVHGRHARTLAELLRRDGVPVIIAGDIRQVQIAAVRKLAWSSLMWLLCHDGGRRDDGDDDGDANDGKLIGGTTMTVGDVHRYKSDQLRALVAEILPSLNALASESPRSYGGGRTISRGGVDGQDDDDDDDGDGDAKSTVGSARDVLDYLEAYSMSISDGNVVPSKELALREIRERNGLLLSATRVSGGGIGGDGSDDGERDELDGGDHVRLIRRVAGEGMLAKCLGGGGSGTAVGDARCDGRDDGRHPEGRGRYRSIRCTSSNLEFLFRHPDDDHLVANDVSNKSAVIVGAGIIGSSIAYHLSVRGVKVTVMDQTTNLLPPLGDNDEDDKCESRVVEDRDMIDPGIATSSSFGWLNANDKSPLSYMQLNHMGMEVWRRHNVLKHLPFWCGSLVRTIARMDDAAMMGGSSPYYARVGPLDYEEARRLEPGVAWPCLLGTNATTGRGGGGGGGGSEVHFYPEEGHVNPLDAVRELRNSARRNGVNFMGGALVDNLIRDGTGKVVGVEYAQSSPRKDIDGEHHHAKRDRIMADIVVIAAGANSSDPVLGVGPDHLRLLDRPGVLAYATRSNDYTSSTGEGRVLQRVFVDTIAQTHMLCRTDNTIVIGGGQLVVGGSEDKSIHPTNTPKSASPSNNENELLGRAMIENALAAVLPRELQPPPASASSGGIELVRVSRANRPVPYDGLPMVGFVAKGLYIAVTHSGITLGPLIGELAAYEICYNDKRSAYGFQILDTYRPSQSRMPGI